MIRLIVCPFFVFIFQCPLSAACQINGSFVWHRKNAYFWRVCHTIILNICCNILNKTEFHLQWKTKNKRKKGERALLLIACGCVTPSCLRPLAVSYQVIQFHSFNILFISLFFVVSLLRDHHYYYYNRRCSTEHHIIVRRVCRVRLLFIYSFVFFSSFSHWCVISFIGHIWF